MINLEKYIKRYNILNGIFFNNNNLKAKRISARLKYKIFNQARQKGIGIYKDTFNYLYLENEYKEIYNTYKKKNYLYCFKMNKIV